MIHSNVLLIDFNIYIYIYIYIYINLASLLDSFQAVSNTCFLFTLSSQDEEV